MENVPDVDPPCNLSESDSGNIGLYSSPSIHLGRANQLSDELQLRDFTPVFKYLVTTGIVGVQSGRLLRLDTVSGETELVGMGLLEFLQGEVRDLVQRREAAGSGGSMTEERLTMSSQLM